MKIAVFHNQPSGGARRALHGFYLQLSDRHDVRVFTLSTADRTMLDEPATVFPYEPLRPVRFGLYVNDLRRRRDLRRLEDTHRTVAAAIDDGGFDVVLADVCRFTGAPFILRHLRTPAAYYCHEPPRALHESAWRPHLTRYQRLRRLWRAPLERQHARHLAAEDRALVRSAGRVLTNSSYTKQRIARIYGVEAVVCPPGVDLPPACSQDGDGGLPYVLSVGALEPHKGFDFLIRALARVPQNQRPALHVVANAQNDAYRGALERHARASGVALTIRVAIADAELRGAYANAALFAFAAHDEPLGLAPLEAMAHELPVVAIGEGGVRETVLDGETGLLVPRDIEAFSRALTDLLSSRDRREAMGKRGRRHVEQRWSWIERGRALEVELEALAVAASATRP